MFLFSFETKKILKRIPIVVVSLRTPGHQLARSFGRLQDQRLVLEHHADLELLKIICL
jgi:hypothetical protein